MKGMKDMNKYKTISYQLHEKRTLIENTIDETLRKINVYIKIYQLRSPSSHSMVRILVPLTEHTEVGFGAMENRNWEWDWETILRFRDDRGVMDFSNAMWFLPELQPDLWTLKKPKIPMKYDLNE